MDVGSQEPLSDAQVPVWCPVSIEVEPDLPDRDSFGRAAPAVPQPAQDLGEGGQALRGVDFLQHLVEVVGNNDAVAAKEGGQRERDRLIGCHILWNRLKAATSSCLARSIRPSNTTSSHPRSMSSGPRSLNLSGVEIVSTTPPPRNVSYMSSVCEVGPLATGPVCLSGGCSSGAFACCFGGVFFFFAFAFFFALAFFLASSASAFFTAPRSLRRLRMNATGRPSFAAQSFTM